MGERSDLSRPNRARQITASEPLQDSPDSARAQCHKGPNTRSANTGCANRRICIDTALATGPRAGARNRPIGIVTSAATGRALCHEVVGKLNAGTSMWETVSTNDLLLMVPSHFSHEIRPIRRNGAHYL